MKTKATMVKHNKDAANPGRIVVEIVTLFSLEKDEDFLHEIPNQNGCDGLVAKHMAERYGADVGDLEMDCSEDGLDVDYRLESPASQEFWGHIRYVNRYHVRPEVANPFLEQIVKSQVRVEKGV